MRRLVETNLLPQKQSSFSLDELSRLYDVASSRISWARDSVFQFWGATSDSTANNKVVSDNTIPLQQQRPTPTSPVMDSEWWFWNIAFALLPAFMIGTYCEFIGQHDMHEFQRRQEIEELKRALGDDFVLPPDLVEEIPTESLVQRLRRIAREVELFFSGPASKDSEGESEGHSVEERKKVEVPQRVGTQVPVPAAQVVDGEDSSTETKPTTSSDSTEQSLLDRIVKLEAIVQKQQERRFNDVMLELDRIRQSGIRNRADEEVRDAYAHRLDQSNEEKQSSSSDTLGTWGTAVLENVTSAIERVQSLLQQQKELEAKGEIAPEPPGESNGSLTDAKKESQKSSDLSSERDNSSQSKDNDVMEGKKDEKPMVSELGRESGARNLSRERDSTKKPWWRVW